MGVDDGYLFFWKVGDTNGYLSQWFISPFVAEGMNFTTAEQYMMYKKAEFFSDHEMMHQIATTPDLGPWDHKRMGKRVRGFNAEAWNKENVRIIAGVNWCKFMQNGYLRFKLMNTGEKTLVEASPVDRVWGIGFDSATALANRHLWGDNRLGTSLMMVRSKIKEMVALSGRADVRL